MFDCCCERCSDKSRTDMTTFMSYLGCHCGGFYNEKLENNTFLCNQCGKSRDLADTLEKLEKIEKEMGDTCDIARVYEELETYESVHDMYYLKVKVSMKYAEQFAHSDDQILLEKVLLCTRNILSLLKKIDPGSSKLTGKFLLLNAETQERLVTIKRINSNDEYSTKELKLIISDILKSKFIANKMLGSNYL